MRQHHSRLTIVSSNTLEIAWKTQIMDWIPVVFVTFKFLVLGTGMFFAIKWHYDQGKKGKHMERETRALLRAGGKVGAVFMLSLVGLGLVTFALARMLGLDLTLP
jgi:preprotein translocase subunit SecY